MRLETNLEGLRGKWNEMETTGIDKKNKSYGKKEMKSLFVLVFIESVYRFGQYGHSYSTSSSSL